MPASRTALRSFTRAARARLVGSREGRAVGHTSVWLCRLVALRILEARGLLPELAGRPAQLAWLAHEIPGPRGAAPRGLDGVAALLTDPRLQPAWHEDETLGWIYQDFHEPEKAAVFARLGAGDKVRPADVAAATRLFTPPWIVAALVQNSLGRLWLQMHPDSRLGARLPYLVPPAQEFPPVPVRPVREITLLEPACGTMHFGLAAFDLFREMYQEELDRAGQPGWPAQPSARNAAAIPTAILTENLHGIDVDPHALEVAALALFLKARTADPGATFPRPNLVCGDALAPERRPRRYDVVATNPPYLGNRHLPAGMVAFLRRHYPDSRHDLYAAFLECGAARLAPHGRLALLTQQSWLFIRRFQALRARLRERVVVETLAHLGPRALAEIDGDKVNTAFFVLRAEADGPRRVASVGTYFRLVREPDTLAKQRAFARSVAGLQAGANDPDVFRCRQGDWDAVPGGPWVYWLTPALGRLFRECRPLADVAEPRAGMHGGDRFRFARYWWEVGLDRIARGCRDCDEALASGKRWFPYMKGGPFRRWYGNQEWVLAFDARHYRILAESGNRLPSRQFYFRPGITYSAVSSRGFSARLSPGGFLFDAGGSSLFPQRLYLTLACLNSKVAAAALQALNPTINFQAGDVGRVPMPSASSPRLVALVEEAIALARAEDAEDETTYDFVAPPSWHTGVVDVAARAARRADVEGLIEEEVANLYGLTAAERAALDAGLAGRNDPPAAPISRAALAARWVSYAVGIALGRFSRARHLAGEGLGPLQANHPEDLAARVAAVLTFVLGGESAAAEVIEAAVGRGALLAGLRAYLAGPFLQQHLRRYHGRPTYWLLQSPRGRFAVYLFHERLTPQTLPRLRQEYLEPQLCRAEADVAEFARLLDAILQGGYVPHPDDGVLLNAAPLWQLLPAWPAARTAWQCLERGRFDWSETALAYWPERVLERCRADRSLALAHGFALSAASQECSGQNASAKRR
jgi:hypothetical protein